MLQHQGPLRPKNQCPHALSLSNEHTSCNSQVQEGLALAFFFFFSTKRRVHAGCSVHSRMCTRAVFLCTRAHAGCHRTTRVYVGPTFLKVNAPPKNKIKCIKEELNARGVSMYLLGPSGSSFRPLKLPESTLFTKGCFWLLVNFSISNGDNELPASIYRLFGPFLSFFGPFLSFFLN
jgi:hypothetical protein